MVTAQTGRLTLDVYTVHTVAGQFMSVLVSELHV